MPMTHTENAAVPITDSGVQFDTRQLLIMSLLLG